MNDPKVGTIEKIVAWGVVALAIALAAAIASIWIVLAATWAAIESLWED